MIEYMEDILLTYRYFLPSAHVLLGQLIDRYNSPPPEHAEMAELMEYKRYLPLIRRFFLSFLLYFL